MGHATRRSTSVLATRVAQPPHEMRAALYRHLHTDAPRRVQIWDHCPLAAWRMMMQVTTPQGPLFVLIGGIPGSGKSTLAVALAAELGLPLLAKDRSKKRSWMPLAIRGPLLSRNDSVGRPCWPCSASPGGVLARYWTAPGSATASRWSVNCPGGSSRFVATFRSPWRERGTGSASPTGTADISTSDGARTSSGENPPSHSA